MTGVRSIALYASGRIGNVISDTAELPDTNRVWLGPTWTGPSEDMIIGRVLLMVASIQSLRPQSSVASSLIFMAYPRARAMGVCSASTSAKLMADGHIDGGLLRGRLDCCDLIDPVVANGPLALNELGARARRPRSPGGGP